MFPVRSHLRPVTQKVSGERVTPHGPGHRSEGVTGKFQRRMALREGRDPRRCTSIQNQARTGARYQVGLQRLMALWFDEEAECACFSALECAVCWRPSFRGVPHSKRTCSHARFWRFNKVSSPANAGDPGCVVALSAERLEAPLPKYTRCYLDGPQSRAMTKMAPSYAPRATKCGLAKPGLP